MSGRDDDDRPGYHDREKKSFSELDRLRREGRGSGERRGDSPAAQRREAEATRQYLKSVDTMFGKGEAAAQEDALARAVLDARGTPGLAEACRTYRDAAGPPEAPRVLACFLECDDPELVGAGLEGALAARAAGRLEPSAGLLGQLRMLADGPDPAVADAAEDLMEALERPVGGS